MKWENRWVELVEVCLEWSHLKARPERRLEPESKHWRRSRTTEPDTPREYRNRECVVVFDDVTIKPVGELCESGIRVTRDVADDFRHTFIDLTEIGCRNPFVATRRREHDRPATGSVDRRHERANQRWPCPREDRCRGSLKRFTSRCLPSGAATAESG